MMKTILALTTLTFLAACSEPTIDASSDTAFEESTTKIRDALSSTERSEFEQAIQTLFMQEMANSLAESGLGFSPDDSAAKSMRMVDGKTADQVIQEAESIRAERARRQREQALKEVEEIDGKIAALESELSDTRADDQEKIAVLKSRFYWSESDYSSRPVIEVTVRNDTKTAISRAYFEAEVASPGRSIPWVSESFNYEIAGGLEPGEQATWTLGPNSYSGWGKAPKDRDDLVMTATAVRADGPDEKPIFEKADPEELSGRIEELKSRRAGLLEFE